MSDKSVLELAKEFQVKMYFGKHHIGKARKYRDKDVTCHMCGRPMTAPEWENTPFYCYKCDEEAESVQRDNCVTNGTLEEHLKEMKEKQAYEDYYPGRKWKG